MKKILLIAGFLIGLTAKGQVVGTPYIVQTKPVITFQRIKTYNVTEAVNRGIGYNGETVPAESTITITVTTTGATPYNFTGTDATTGLTYSASGTFPSSGTFDVVLQNNSPLIATNKYGNIYITLTGASNTLNLYPRIDIKTIPANQTAVVEVAGANGTIWMDRNLGAFQPASSSTDNLSFGNKYQWGRPSDGHEIMVYYPFDYKVSVGFSGTTTTLSSTDTPADSKFIVNSTASPYDWRSPQNNNLWKGVSGTNNPCPSGFRLPTRAELNAEVATFATANSAGAFSSNLKLPAAGQRSNSDGYSINFNQYWSSDTSGNNAYSLVFSSTSVITQTRFRASANSVRCIKN